MKSSQPRSTPDSGNAGRVKWVYGGGAAVKEVRKGYNDYEEYEMKRIRDAEKAEKIMHLICWGPTK